MSGRLAGKVAIVTGAAGGIGAATAKRFADEGARVVIVDRDESSLFEVARNIGLEVMAAPADVSSLPAMLHVVERAVAAFGGLDVMFANAGIEGIVKPLLDTTPEELDRVLAVNVRGAFNSIRAAAPAIAKRGGGAILVTSSVAGLVGASGLAPYITSKHAVMGLVKAAAIELAAQKIRVAAINPGPIENRMMRSIEAQASPADPGIVKAGFEALVPLRRYGTNEEIANLALFLASDEASYCTGGAFVADGGYVAQ
ncbi:MAG: glucose 1-dehydrogenase [Polyangiaceae bacterium]